MRTVFRNITGITALLVVIYIVSNYSAQIQEQIGVKGVNTSRAQEISGSIASDLGQQVDVVASRAGEIKISQVIGFFQRFQKIPQDINNAKAYIQEQADAVLKSKDTGKVKSEK